MYNQKYIISSILIFIFISFSLLAFWERNQHQIEDGWFIYFNNIADKSTTFTIENYSPDKNFSWEIIADNNSIRKENIEVLKNNNKSVIIDEQLTSKSVKIIVSHSKKTKEIYKNFE
jgi:hypothetical protein